MKLEMSIGGRAYTAIEGPHEGTDVPAGTTRVTGPGLKQAAEYATHTDIDKGAHGRCIYAISYTVNNIVLPNLFEALQRADRLVEHMSGYIGQMSPGSYTSLYTDLNEHGLFMDSAGIKDTASRP